MEKFVFPVATCPVEQKQACSVAARPGERNPACPVEQKQARLRLTLVNRTQLALLQLTLFHDSGNHHVVPVT